MLTFKFQAIVACARCTAYLHGQVFEGASLIRFNSYVLQNTANKEQNLHHSFQVWGNASLKNWNSRKYL